MIALPSTLELEGRLVAQPLGLAPRGLGLPSNHQGACKALPPVVRVGGDGQQFRLVQNHANQGEGAGVSGGKTAGTVEERCELILAPWPVIGRRGMDLCHVGRADQSSRTGGTSAEGAASAGRM